jgi:PAS domain S-box-containing protein
MPVESHARVIDSDNRQEVPGMTQDITQHQRAAEDLRTAAQTWRTTFAAIEDAFYLLDSECKILECNQALADLVGKPFSEIVGRPCWKVVHGTAGPINDCPMKRLRRTHRREELVLAMGESWFRVTVHPILDGAGGLTGAVHLIVDITALQKTEQELKLRKTLIALAPIVMV